MSLYANHRSTTDKPEINFDIPVEILIALPIVMECEGLSLSEYLCPANIPTIGYGHVIRDEDNFPPKISPQEAESLLVEDLKKFLKAIKPMVIVELNANQFAALLSFTFNVGITALKASTLLRKINRGDDFVETADQFERWIYADGRKLRGLQLRRAREKRLFLSKERNMKDELESQA